MTAIALPKEQNQALGKIAMAVSFRFIVITLVIAVLMIGGLAVIPATSFLIKNLQTMVYVAIALQIILFLLLAQLLQSSIQRSAKNFQLKLVDSSHPFAPYKWRWFGIVVAIHIAAGAIAMLTWFLIHVNINVNSGIGVAVTLFAYQIATIHVINNLINSGEAILEPID